MEIKTERLGITALTPAQLRWLLDDIPRLERELRCSYRAQPIEGIFKEILEGQLRRAETDRANYLWHSFWLIIRKPDGIAVGLADFKRPPDENGEVEIGYGLGQDFRHLGYMTEAVRAMCNWAMGQEGVRHIIAETDLDGLASQRILLRCGFAEYGRGETVWWRL